MTFTVILTNGTEIKVEADNVKRDNTVGDYVYFYKEDLLIVAEFNMENIAGWMMD